jgi:hypothetical protein
MQLNTKLAGDFSCKSIKFYPQTNARIFKAALDVRMTEDAMDSIFGAGLAGIAFSGVDTDEDGNVTWGYKETTPDAKFSEHLLQLYTKSVDGPQRLGPQLGVTPEVSKIKPAPDEPKVIVTIALPIEAKDQRLCGALAMAVGELITAELEAKPVPKQEELPGTGKTPAAPVATPTGPHGNVVMMPGTG